jgi:hypothetical protein
MNSVQTLARTAVLALALLVAACAKQAPADAGAQAVAGLPKWDGYWTSASMRPEIFGFDKEILKGDVRDQKVALEILSKTYPLVGATAPWNDASRGAFFAMLGKMGARKADGWGYPMMMNGPAAMQFLITPEETLIVNLYREVRHIYTDGRPLTSEEDRWVTTWGESVGHWEGDTLVVETVGVRNPLEFFMLAPPLSEKARYVERIRRTGPDSMEIDFTIEDPETLTAPWHTTAKLLREKQLDRLVHDAFTNDRSELENGVFDIEPAKP